MPIRYIGGLNEVRIGDRVRVRLFFVLKRMGRRRRRRSGPSSKRIQGRRRSVALSKNGRILGAMLRDLRRAARLAPIPV